ncbi:ATP-binding protein [Streptomyces sp. NPDC058646]|uniref:sensor histidine kinase n=1 Tax=Streptomyces sp. NPDC058646 TaxID=3346574 RepID=UPI0036541025
MSGLRAARHSPSRHAVTGPGRQLRPQLLRAALLPTLAAGLSGAAAVIFTLQLGGGAGDRDPRLWPVLTGCALLVAGALAAALLGAQRSAKAVQDRCEALRRSSVRGRQELRTAAERLGRGEVPPRPVRGGPSAPPVGADPAGVDEFWLLSQELRGAREQAHATLVRLAGPATPSDSERKVEVFVNLARRLQSLVHREISLLDELEDSVEDPDLLRELFHVDHLATRIRRHAENLAVLGGAASRRQWTRPIDLSEVLRSSVAEVEQYTRVKVVPPSGGSVRGHAVADVVHLLAELVENATVFSAPDTDVVLRAERVTAGIAVEVEDRGLGMPAEEQHRMNALLGDPDQISVRHLLADGRIGLFVVSALARRHGIAVELKSNIYGGVLAVLVLPQELLGAEAPGAADAAGSRATSWGTGEGAGAPPLEPVRVTLPRQEAPPPWTSTAASPEPAAAPPAGVRRAGGRAENPVGAGPGPGGDPRTESWAQDRLGGLPSPRPGERSGPDAGSGGQQRNGAPEPAPPPVRTSAPAGDADPATARLRSEKQRRAPAPARTGPPHPYGAHAPAPPPTQEPTPAQAPAGAQADDPAGARAQESRASSAAAHGQAWPRTQAPTSAPAQDPPWAEASAQAPAAAPVQARDAAWAPARVPSQTAAPGAAQDRGRAPARGRASAPAPLSPAEDTAQGPVTDPFQGSGPGAPQVHDPAWGQADGPGWGDLRAQEPSGAAASTPADGQAWVQAQQTAPAPVSDTAPALASDTAPAPAQGPVPLSAQDPVRGGPQVQGSAWGRAEAASRAQGSALEPPPAGPPAEDRPALPRRRAQEHLAPQLREAPAPRRVDGAEQPLHDPGLMAAFQRGFGRAQSEHRT